MKRHNVKRGIERFSAEFEQTSAGKSKLLELRKQIRAQKSVGKVHIGGSGADVKFAVISDLHIGSKYCRPNLLRSFYDYSLDRGYSTFLCAGDVVDGWKIYKGQEFEQNHRGWTEQRDAFLEIAPQVGKTYFITGNHDDSFEKLAGAIIGEELERISSTWSFVGQNNATLEFGTKEQPIIVTLLHPGGGSAYALSYRPQRLVEQWEGGSKPHLLIVGHFHKAEFMPQYRNVAILQGGTFQAQTPFMQGKGISAHRGGWLVDLRHEGTHMLVKTEFVSFFD